MIIRFMIPPLYYIYDTQVIFRTSDVSRLYADSRFSETYKITTSVFFHPPIVRCRSPSERQQTLQPSRGLRTHLLTSFHFSPQVILQSLAPATCELQSVIRFFQMPNKFIEEWPERRKGENFMSDGVVRKCCTKFKSG